MRTNEAVVLAILSAVSMCILLPTAAVGTKPKRSDGTVQSEAALRTWIFEAPQEAEEYHPILKVKAGHGLAGKRLDDKVFKQLNHCDSLFSKLAPNSNHYYWGAYYSKAEQEAAEQFCSRACGKTKSAIEKIAGQPSYKGGTISCWKWSKPGQDIWLYQFGIRSIPVYLVFKKDMCVKAEIVSISEFNAYEDWRTDEICKFAKGKKLNELLAKLGTPTYARNKYNFEVPQPYDLENLETIYYVVGPHRVVSLKIEYGRCTSTSAGFLAH